MSTSLISPEMAHYLLVQATTATPPPSTIDFTSIAVAVVGGVFSIIGIVATSLINSRMKDTQAAATLNTALTNSLGAVQNAVDVGLKLHPLQATLPAGVSPQVATGVQYVLDHAGDEATRLGVTPAAMADKIEAKMGLTKIPGPGPVAVANA
jgi:hypothetical protein